MKQEIIDRINLLAREGDPFLFVINYRGDDAFIRKLADIDPRECLYDFEGTGNVEETTARALPSSVTWEVDAPQYDDYSRSLNIVKSNIIAGNSYLANLTCKVPVRCNLSLDDIFRVAEERGETPLIVVCDGIEDPHNLGAIIRSAETAGAHGVIIPKRRAVGLTASVARSAAGALAYVGVHKANNLASTLDELKERGVWLFGAEADGTVDLYEAPFDRATAIVIGSEGQGLSRLTRDKCDYIVSIPMRGRVNSLNASNAAAVLLFEALRRRLGH